jgi:hypothetical protein
MEKKVDQMYKSLCLGANYAVNMQGTLVEDALPFLEKYNLIDDAEKYSRILKLPLGVISIHAKYFIDHFSLKIKIAACQELIEIGRKDIIEKVKEDLFKSKGDLPRDIFDAENIANIVV